MAAPPGRDDPPQDPARPTVLVVDDVPLLREVMALALAPIARVVQAPDDAAAERELRTLRPALVIAHHPPPTGMTSICEVVKRGPRRAFLPVLLTVAGERPQDRAAAVLAGADDVLAKPLEQGVLVSAARRLLEAPALRGLPRVPVETPVRLGAEAQEHWGVARNLSRGGIFVETDAPLPPRSEVRLEFPLPGDDTVLAPTAAVVWCRPRSRGPGPGLGLRFLALDGSGARRLAHFIAERLAPRPGAPLLEATP